MGWPSNDLSGSNFLAPIHVQPAPAAAVPVRAKTDQEIYDDAKQKALDQVSGDIGRLFQSDIGTFVKEYLPAQLLEYSSIQEQQFCSPILGEVMVECRTGYSRQIASLSGQLRERGLDSSAIETVMRNLIIVQLVFLKGELDSKHPGLLERLGLARRPVVYAQQPDYAYGWGRPVEPARKTFREIFTDSLGRNYTDFDDTINSINATLNQTHILNAREFTDRYSKADESLQLDDRTQQFVSKFFEATKSNYVDTAEYRRRLQDLNNNRDIMNACMKNLATPHIMSIKAQIEADMGRHPYARRQFQEVLDGVASYRI